MPGYVVPLEHKGSQNGFSSQPNSAIQFFFFNCHKRSSYEVIDTGNSVHATNANIPNNIFTDEEAKRKSEDSFGEDV